MMGKDIHMQGQFIFVDLNEFIPEDHLLRAIKNMIDFSFIYEKVDHLYSPIGRRSIDPVMLIKMLLLGYLYGIPSERKLEQEVKMNLAYRWFLGLDLGSSIPDHSTLSQNRRRRFKDSSLFQKIFDTIVSRCIAEGLVTGDVIVTDSTHIKASASRNKAEKITVEKKPSDYLLALEREAQRLEVDLEAKRKQLGKEKCGKKAKPRERTVKAEVVRSTTDPDAGLLDRPNKPGGFHYLNHTSIDAKHGIITDVFVTAGNVNDHVPYIERLRMQKEKFGLNIEKVGADKGYDHPEVHYGLEQLGILGYIPPIETNYGGDAINRKEFTYHEDNDIFVCPVGNVLRFTHLAKSKTKNKIGKVYAAKTKDCANCPIRQQCFGKSGKFRTIQVALFQDIVVRNRDRSRTPDYYQVQRLRRIWCEGTFGIQKAHHNLNKTYKRGIEKVKEQCLLSALAINIKRIIKAS
jgi:transposase